MKRIALVGMPNSGKSTLFNRLTGGRARVGNWPGITVDLLEGQVILGDQMVKVVDLPGLHDLQGASPDERVSADFLRQQSCDLVLAIFNLPQLDRQLPLLAQLAELGLPIVVVLNMADEARHLGINCTPQALQQRLGCPVVAISAAKGENWAELQTTLLQALRHPPAPMSRPDTAPAKTAEHWLNGIFTLPHQLSATLSARLDHWALHPVVGLLVLVAILLSLFGGVYWLGTGLQDGLESGLTWLRQPLAGAISHWSPFWQGLLLNGLYDGAGSVLTFAPLIALFFVSIAILEDSGYLARIAFLLDATFARLHLDGRAFVLWMMGMGCNIPGLLGTRIVRDLNARRRIMLAIPFALCSARLQVFLFIGSLIFGGKALLVVAGLYLLSVLAMFLTARVFRLPQAPTEAFTLEIPPYRLPQARYVLMRSLGEVGGFLKLATGWIVAGCLLVWWLGYAHWQGISLAEHLAGFFGPLLAPLGIPAVMGIALLLGFAAKEAVVGALAVSFSQHLPLDAVSAASFLVFTLLYTPCLSTLAVLHREMKSWRWTCLTLAWSLSLAWILAFLVYQLGSRI